LKRSYLRLESAIAAYPAPGFDAVAPRDSLPIRT